MRRIGSIIWMLLLLLVPLIAILPNVTHAHTILVEASPVPNSHLNSSPNEIVLVFNEHLQEQLYELQVLNGNGETIYLNEAKLDPMEKNRITVQIPPLEDGVYTVTYQVTGSDGHSVRGSYRFAVGEEAYILTEEANVGVNSLTDGAIYAIRIIYVISLLLLVGWLFWGRFIRTDTAHFRQFRQFIALLLQIVHLLALIMMILLQMAGFTTGYDDPVMIPIGTGFGLSWLLSLLLAFLGLFALHRSTIFDTGWIACLMVAKSFNGHAMMADPVWLGVVLGFVHMVAAAVWGGGLLFLLACWKKFRLYIAELLPVFSRTALFCMFVLWCSGVLTATLLISDLDMLFSSAWGRLLLLKIISVLCVTIFAALLRSRIHSGKSIHSLKKWIAVDFGLMVVITGIAALLAYVTPV